MAGTFLVKALTPNEDQLRHQSAQIRGYLLAVSNKYRRLLREDFGKVIRTWEHTKGREDTVLRTQVRLVGSMSVELYVFDKIFEYDDRGTRIRYAVMSKPFVPKTKQAWIGSRIGRGRKLFVLSKKRGKFRPGIQARNWSITIAMKHARPFAKDVQDAINKGISISTVSGM